ncbi:MAG TPA: hypothetical protein VLJ59_14585 [Mycobacteriales bacterium]|nr:hypothetical protein [Mycobacteriales bacterium]
MNTVRMPGRAAAIGVLALAAFLVGLVLLTSAPPRRTTIMVAPLPKTAAATAAAQMALVETATRYRADLVVLVGGREAGLPVLAVLGFAQTSPPVLVVVDDGGPTAVATRLPDSAAVLDDAGRLVREPANGTGHPALLVFWAGLLLALGVVCGWSTSARMPSVPVAGQPTGPQGQPPPVRRKPPLVRPEPARSSPVASSPVIPSPAVLPSPTSPSVASSPGTQEPAAPQSDRFDGSLSVRPDILARYAVGGDEWEPQCPRCGSVEVSVEIKARPWRCRACDHSWTAGPDRTWPDVILAPERRRASQPYESSPYENE